MEYIDENKSKNEMRPKDILPGAFAEGVKSIRDLYDEKKSELGMTDRQIQKMLSMDSKALNPILQGTAKRINFISAIKLASFLDITLSEVAQSYLKDEKEISEVQKARDSRYLIENFDVTTLTKIGFLKKSITAAEMAHKITVFFGLNSIYEYSEDKICTAFSKTKRKTPDELMRDFWITSANFHFSHIKNPNLYNRAALIELMPRIRSYTMNIKNGLTTVLRALFQVGVTVIFQPKLENTQVRGATMVVNNTPCIVISNLHNNYPTLWFALLHELNHVLFDLDDIKDQTYHISDGVGDLFLTNEEKADAFANNYLLNDSRLKFAKRYINSPTMIAKFARECNVHPSIIYARYCYVYGNWSFYKKYIPGMDDAIKFINTHPFEKEMLMESVNEIKLFFNI